MTERIYHPNAYLKNFRNIEPGLRSRTAILNVLENTSADAKTISNRSELNYPVVLYHLRLLESREIVERKGSRPYIWQLTGIGQRRLNN
ncbi:MAG: hypothetical protein GWO20_02430 [Candidatus Korarchaeota archaeon]|nr:hypothetical protein [Candidatus Korarchaeota archaeon]